MLIIMKPICWLLLIAGLEERDISRELTYERIYKLVVDGNGNTSLHIKDVITISRVIR